MAGWPCARSGTSSRGLNSAGRSLHELFKCTSDGGQCCRRLIFDEGGFGDHADPQLRALVGVWACECDEVGTAQLGVGMVAMSDLVGYCGLGARFQQERAHTTVA